MDVDTRNSANLESGTTIVDAGLFGGMFLLLLISYLHFFARWMVVTLFNRNGANNARIVELVYKMDFGTGMVCAVMGSVMVTSAEFSEYAAILFLIVVAAIPIIFAGISQKECRSLELSVIGPAIAGLIYGALVVYGIVAGSISLLTVRQDIRELVTEAKLPRDPSTSATILRVKSVVLACLVMSRGIIPTWTRKDHLLKVFLLLLCHILYAASVVVVVFVWPFPECNGSISGCIVSFVANYARAEWPGRWILGALLAASPFFSIYRRKSDPQDDEESVNLQMVVTQRSSQTNYAV